MKKKLYGVTMSLIIIYCINILATKTIALEIKRHETQGIINLVPGEERGTITLPLERGVIASTGQEVLFVLSDVSDGKFAEKYGGIRADSLAEAPEASVEPAVFDNGEWIFFEDAGFVCHFDENGNVIPPIANTNYSPLKRFQWKGKTVTANVPFVKWGDKPGQQLIVDKGGCDPLIRINAPNPFFVGNGPFDGADCFNEGPLDRYKGGQVVDLDLENMTVTMKLHKAIYKYPDKLPYYTVFEASKAPPAGFMGVIHAPKLGNIGRFKDNKAVGRISQFSNGVRNLGGGPNRFQIGMVSYTGGQAQIYSPMWHITWVIFDCDGDGEFFSSDRNVGEGAIPVPGSGISKFDPSDPVTFDPFGMDDKGVSCLEFAIMASGNNEGILESIGAIRNLVEDGLAVETEGPAGLRLNSPLQPPLIVNCPVPLTVE